MPKNEFLMLAQQALVYVAKTLPSGAGNDPTNVNQVSADQFVLHQRVERMLDGGMYTPSSASANAMMFGAGNCGEQARLAFTYLKRRGAVPLDVMNVYTQPNPIDHSFLVIGRTTGLAQSNCMNWGPDAVVCDPWTGFLPEINLQHTPVAAFATDLNLGVNAPLYTHAAWSLERWEGALRASEAPF